MGKFERVQVCYAILVTCAFFVIIAFCAIGTGR